MLKELLTPIDNKVEDLGLTRDSLVWFWSKLVSGAALIASGLLPLHDYFSETWVKAITTTAVVVLWFAGRMSSSPLPGGKK